MNRRAGVTLLEMAVAMVVGAVLLTTALAAQLGLDRASRSRAERAGSGATLRTAAGALRWELSSLGTDSVSGPDLAAASAGAITFRAHRGLAIVCRLAPDSVVFSAARLGAWQSRGLAALSDSVLIYAPGDSVAVIDAWLAVPLLSGPFSRACPSGEPGDLFGTILDSATIAALRLPARTIARGFEIVEIEGYSGGSGWQLGEAGISAGGTIQPLAGPLDGPTGVVFSLWDRDGAGVSLPAAAAGIDIVVRALARREVAVGPGRAPPSRDSVRLGYRLGNVP